MGTLPTHTLCRPHAGLYFLMHWARVNVGLSSGMKVTPQNWKMAYMPGNFWML